MLKVFLKISGQNSAVVLENVNRSWTVLDLKHYIADQHKNINVENLKLIFSGKELNDRLVVEDCDIDQNTTLFGVCQPVAVDVSRRTFSRDQEGGFTSLHSHIEGLDDQGEELAQSSKGASWHLKPQLYVYCSMPCKSIQAGKLRVCCNQCKQGSFTVQQDPTCWEDVLLAGAIKGTCQTEGCHGNTSEFYFKCGNHATSEDERAVVLQHIKSNTKQVMCLTCADIRNPVLVFPCGDRHTICLECFHEYCLTQLNDRQFIQHDELGYTLPCPSGCENSFIAEIHHFKILGETQYQRYKQFAAEECLLSNGGVLCPTPGCGAGIFLTDDQIRRVECVKQGDHGCGAVFCKDCHRPYHQGPCHHQLTDARPTHNRSYRVDSVKAEQAKWERQQSEETIDKTTKPCPNCKTPTEKDGGCMHMTCSRPQCKFDWCWVCQIKWNHTCMAEHWFDVN